VRGQGSVRAAGRVIAATNKTLADEIRAGRFREDLFFRLNVIPIFVPALRDRREDVPRLAEHFIAEFAHEYGRRPKVLSAEAGEVLGAYGWPGNVRELRNVIERLIIMVPGDVILPADLSFLDVSASASRGIDAVVVASLFDARDAWERSYILGVLASCDGNISRTADALGLERSNLYKKMRTLGIGPTRERVED
jgi:two-component system nitrogen regulation response regulator NtrX